MFKFAIFVIIGAALFHQAFSSNTPVKSSKDDAKKAFHKLMEVIDKALTEAEKALDKAMDEVNAKATELENKATAELDKVMEPLKKKLDDLIEKAEAKGFNITQCQSYVDDFSNIPDQMVHDLISCITVQVEKAQKYVDDALTNIKAIEQDMNNIDAEIDNCSGNEVKKLKCYAKIIAKIAKETENAPQHIAEDVAKATVLVTELIPIMEQCFTDKLKKAEDDAVKDVADFAICAAV